MIIWYQLQFRPRSSTRRSTSPISILSDVFLEYMSGITLRSKWLVKSCCICALCISMTDKLGKNNERGQGRWKYFFPRILSDCQLITEMNNWWTYDGASSWISCYLLEHERVMSWEKMWENGWVNLKSKSSRQSFIVFSNNMGFYTLFFIQIPKSFFVPES